MGADRLFWGGPKKSRRCLSVASGRLSPGSSDSASSVERKPASSRSFGKIAFPRAGLATQVRDLLSNTFFGWSPKKSPFFSAPKKPKKSPVNQKSQGLAMHELIARPCTQLVARPARISRRIVSLSSGQSTVTQERPHIPGVWASSETILG